MAYSFAGRKVDIVLDTEGTPQPNRTYQLFVWGTSTPATLYTNRTKETLRSGPLSLNNRGYFDFFADPGEYGIVVQGESQQQYVPVAEDPDETVNHSDIGDSVAALVDGIVPLDQLPDSLGGLELSDLADRPSMIRYAGSSYPARPARPAGMVIYVGPVQPTSWLTGDLWIEAG